MRDVVSLVCVVLLSRVGFVLGFLSGGSVLLLVNLRDS